jgi:chlorite dismutase
MLRKPILMPPSMIDKVDKIANERKVSFAQVVREAVDAFDGDLSMEDEALLEALADTMIKTTREVVEKIDAIEKRLDETHAILETK